MSRHDKRMIVALIVAIAMGPTLPFGLGFVQMAVCAFSLYCKLDKNFPSHE